jgi:glycosyltransferase involved in cell wall biosynthesis
MNHGISIIICCHNSAERLPMVLQNLSVQKRTDNINYEIIIVDNASTDDTTAVARNNWMGNPEIFKIIHEKNPGLSYARMAGLAASIYDIINFIDDDNLVNPEWIHSIYSIMKENSSIGMLGGLGIPKFDSEPPPWFSKFQDAYAVGPQGSTSGFVPKSRMYLHGAGITIRRKIWNELDKKGFKFQLTGRKGKSLSSGEDYELSCAVRILGYQLYYEEKLTFEHMIPEQRLKPAYLVNLFKAFGVASNYTFLYKTYLLGNKKSDKLKYEYWITSLLYSVYKYVRCYANNGINNIEFNPGSVRLGYWKQNMLFKIKNPIKFQKAKNEIRKFINSANDNKPEIKD